MEALAGERERERERDKNKEKKKGRGIQINSLQYDPRNVLENIQ